MQKRSESRTFDWHYSKCDDDILIRNIGAVPSKSEKYGGFACR